MLLYCPWHQAADSLLGFSFWPHQRLASFPFLHFYLILFFLVKTAEHPRAGKSPPRLQCCHGVDHVQAPRWVISSPWMLQHSQLKLQVGEATTSTEWTVYLTVPPQTVAYHLCMQINDWGRSSTEAWTTTKKIVILPRGWTSLPVWATSRHLAISSFSSWE